MGKRKSRGHRKERREIRFRNGTGCSGAYCARDGDKVGGNSQEELSAWGPRECEDTEGGQFLYGWKSEEGVVRDMDLMVTNTINVSSYGIRKTQRTIHRRRVTP